MATGLGFSCAIYASRKLIGQFGEQLDAGRDHGDGGVAFELIFQLLKLNATVG